MLTWHDGLEILHYLGACSDGLRWYREETTDDPDTPLKDIYEQVVDFNWLYWLYGELYLNIEELSPDFFQWVAEYDRIWLTRSRLVMAINAGVRTRVFTSEEACKLRLTAIAEEVDACDRLRAQFAVCAYHRIPWEEIAPALERTLEEMKRDED
jgi:hypothetical protein